MNASDLVIVLMTVLGASSTIVAKSLLEVTPPLTLVFVRFTSAALLFYVIRRKVIHETLRESWKAGALIGCGFGCGCILLYYGLRTAGSGHAALLINIEVAIVPILGYFLFRSKPVFLEYVGIVVALFGLWIFTDAKNSSLSLSDGVLLFSACSYAFYTITLSHFAKQGSLSARIFVAFVTIAVLSGVCALFSETASFDGWNSSHLLLMAYFVIVATVGRLIGQSWGQAGTSATRTALIFTLEPLFTLAMSSYFYGESFQRHQYIGGAMLLTASVLAALPRPKGKDIVIP